MCDPLPTSRSSGLWSGQDRKPSCLLLAAASMTSDWIKEILTGNRHVYVHTLYCMYLSEVYSGKRISHRYLVCLRGLSCIGARDLSAYPFEGRETLFLSLSILSLSLSLIFEDVSLSEFDISFISLCAK